jgi:hypothetical protein
MEIQCFCAGCTCRDVDGSNVGRRVIGLYICILLSLLLFQIQKDIHIVRYNIRTDDLNNAYQIISSDKNRNQTGKSQVFVFETKILA